MGKKTAVLAIRITNDQAQAPAPLVAKPRIPVNIPEELRPDFVPPPHPSAPDKKLQVVGYQRQDVSIDQVKFSFKCGLELVSYLSSLGGTNRAADFNCFFR